MRMNLFFRYISLAFAASVFALVSCGKTAPTYIRVEGQMLGTFMQVSAHTDRPSSEIYALMMQIDSASKSSMSIFDKSSLLSRVNRNETDSLDTHIIHCLELSRRVSEVSNGAYDVTIAPLVEAYGFAGKERLAEVNVDSLLEFVGIDKVRVKEGCLVKDDSRLRLDFNSIAKGYVVDMAAEELERLGIENYLVDIGGEVRCKGVNSKGGAWRVGIETPFDGNNTPGAYVQQVISLSDCSMATSGNYRRYYLDEQGRKVAHTIDPRTGKSVITNLLSATVVAPTCAEADAFGTMFMALGLEEAIETARELEPSGVMVYFIAAGEGDDFKIYCSSKLAPMIKGTQGMQIIK